MEVTIMIPARFASTRYPGKPLVPLKSADGRTLPLIQWTWLRAKSVQKVHQVYVVTDDQRIAACVEDFGGKVIMTSENCANGTERCAEALTLIEHKPEVVINLQGDSPLTPPRFVEALISSMEDRHDVNAATPVLRCDSETYQHFVEDRKEGRVGGTTAVFAKDNHALYFSKEVIPYLPQSPENERPHVYHHVGVYAYRTIALMKYRNWQPGPLEQLEGLEQLRFLEHDERILCVEVESQGNKFWELNNPVDVKRIESAL